MDDPLNILPDGAYCLATKYHDGDPGDHYCVGFYAGYHNHFGQIRHFVVDHEKKHFRANGFRRVELITSQEGKWLIEHFAEFEPMWVGNDEQLYGKSVWDWLAQYRRGER